MSGNGMKERLRKTAAEALLVALFLLVFVLLLKFLLPEGAGLRRIVRGGGAEGSRSGETGERLLPRGLPDSSRAAVPIAGHVDALRNDVQSRRANSIAWGRAAAGMRLYSRDAVQTSRDSSASIRIGGKGTIHLGEKSLLVIRRMEREAASGARRSILLMVDGEIRGRIEGTRREPVSVDVASAGGVGRIVSRGGGDGEADFRVTVNPGRTTTYSIFEGTAEVEGMGRSVTVRSNQYTVVAPWAPPTAPAALPAAPAIDGPGDGAEYLFRSLPPRVRFSWTPAEGAEAYRIVLARDPGFKVPVVDEWVAGSSFLHGNLPEGEYYWRVTSKRDGVESGYPKARTVRLLRKADPPPLRAEAVPDPLRGDRCRVSGATDPDASLLVGGKAVAPGRMGEFESIVPLERGINMIVVEASDAAGNTAYRSLRATGK